MIKTENQFRVERSKTKIIFEKFTQHNTQIRNFYEKNLSIFLFTFFSYIEIFVIIKKS